MILILLTLFPVIGGLLLPLFNKIQNRNARLSSVVLIQAFEAILGFMVILGDKISTGSFTLVDQISVGFTADTLAKFFVALVVNIIAPIIDRYLVLKPVLSGGYRNAHKK